jgi:hypothetical protein
MKNFVAQSAVVFRYWLVAFWFYYIDSVIVMNVLGFGLLVVDIALLDFKEIGNQFDGL